MAQYTIWIYPPSAFVGGLPDEQNAIAAGGSNHTLTLAANAQPIAIVVEDNEGDFGEEINGPTQYIVNPVTIDGVTYPAGSNILTAYDLTNSGSGHQVTSFHITSGDGYTVGPVQGVVSTEILRPGQSYNFDQNVSSYNQNNPYSQYVCFARGTRVMTPAGERPIENLRVGDQVLTRDNGVQTIRWIGSRTVAARGDLAPITLCRGALGEVDGAPIPTRDMTVSPQHRFLLSDWRCELVVGASEALVAAKHMTGNDRIYRSPRMTVEYFHMMFDAHEVIFAEGAEAESFHPGIMGKDAVGAETWEEICTLFPELADEAETRELAYPQVTRSEAKVVFDIPNPTAVSSAQGIDRAA